MKKFFFLTIAVLFIGLFTQSCLENDYRAKPCSTGSETTKYDDKSQGGADGFQNSYKTDLIVTYECNGQTVTEDIGYVAVNNACGGLEIHMRITNDCWTFISGSAWYNLGLNGLIEINGNPEQFMLFDEARSGLDFKAPTDPSWYCDDVLKMATHALVKNNCTGFCGGNNEFSAWGNGTPFEEKGIDRHGWYFDYPVNCGAGNGGGNDNEPCGSVIIGTQEWMGCNLDVDHYRNGDPIPQVTDPIEWANLTTGAWCYYNNDPLLGQIYGKLYNWYAVNDPRGLAPAGWHVPIDDEWAILCSYLGGSDLAGGRIIEAGTAHWEIPNSNANNESGFTALPGGWRHDNDGSYRNKAYHADWWTSTKLIGSSDARYWGTISGFNLVRSAANMRYGFSVRCIKGEPPAICGVKIGDQIWMCKNLDVDHYRNGDPIPQVTDPTEWGKLMATAESGKAGGAWCYYNNDPLLGQIYGKLYNWYAVNDPRGLAPEGWHVATDAEWTTLEDFLDGSNVAGGKLKEEGTAHWLSPNSGATNESGFSALPGGWREVGQYPNFSLESEGIFHDIGNAGRWWSSTQYEGHERQSWFRQIWCGSAQINRYYWCFKHYGFSVRCVKD